MGGWFQKLQIQVNQNYSSFFFFNFQKCQNIVSEFPEWNISTFCFRKMFHFEISLNFILKNVFHFRLNKMFCSTKKKQFLNFLFCCEILKNFVSIQSKQFFLIFQFSHWTEESVIHPALFICVSCSLYSDTNTLHLDAHTSGQPCLLPCFACWKCTKFLITWAKQKVPSSFIKVSEAPAQATGFFITDSSNVADYRKGSNCSTWQRIKLSKNS